MIIVHVPHLEQAALKDLSRQPLVGCPGLAAVTADLDGARDYVRRDQEAPVIRVDAKHRMPVPLCSAAPETAAAGKADGIAVVDRVDAVGIEVRKKDEPDAARAKVTGTQAITPWRKMPVRLKPGAPRPRRSRDHRPGSCVAHRLPN